MTDPIAPRLQAILDNQRQAFAASQPEALSVRRDRMDRALDLLLAHKDTLAKAVSADFGSRSIEQTLIIELFPSIAALKHAKKHVERWSRDEKRKPLLPLWLLGGRARVMYQPKGVVGVIAPWNLPLGLLMGPLAGILAAGNRAMLKPSEFTPRVAGLLAEIVPNYFAEDEVAVVTGDVEVAKAFSKLAFDHLVFTGSTAVGRQIMRAAAENLVPVTLELGGKSPVIVGRSANLRQAAERIAIGKLTNVGQLCLSPDYLLVAREQEQEVIRHLVAAASAMYPTLSANADFSSVINRQNRERLQGYLAEARSQGAELIEVNPNQEDLGGGARDSGTSGSSINKMPLTLVRGVTDRMALMQHEIFGPILPVLTYDTVDEAIAHVNAQDRPLALYYFGTDRAEERHVLSHTISGGVTVNDVLFHHAMEDLPFGGVGASGMGSYHGVDGFKAVSHARAIYRQPRLDVAALTGFKPPYGKVTQRSLQRELRK